MFCKIEPSIIAQKADLLADFGSLSTLAYLS